MLVYHAYSDINHGIFRTFLLRKFVFGASIEFDYWRILDFLFVFPHMSEELRVPRPLIKKRNEMSRFYTKYNDIREPREFIYQTQNVHLSIASILSAKGIISKKDLSVGKITWTVQECPLELNRLLEERAVENNTVLSFLKLLREVVPAKGPGGIKERSGWMEHRYDA